MTVLLGFAVMIAVDHFAHVSSDASSAASMSAFSGLVLPAAADGIAVGVSAAAAAANTASASASSVEFTILLAITLHKVPASLGLGSKLLLVPDAVADADGSAAAASAASRKRKLGICMLLAFAVASPLSALLTYAMTAWALSPASASQELSPAEAQGQMDAAVHAAQPWLGLTFLFAGGTFLHVAVTHGLPAHSHGHSHTPGSALQHGGSAGATAAHSPVAWDEEHSDNVSVLQRSSHSPGGAVAPSTSAHNSDSEEEPLIGQSGGVTAEASLRGGYNVVADTAHGALGSELQTGGSCAAACRVCTAKARAGNVRGAAQTACCTSAWRAVGGHGRPD